MRSIDPAEREYRHHWLDGETRHLAISDVGTAPQGHARVQRRYTLRDSGELLLDDHFTLVLHSEDEHEASRLREIIPIPDEIRAPC